MTIQVFKTEQEAKDHASSPEFTLFCLLQWGMSDEEAVATMKRLFAGDPLSEADTEWLRKLRLAQESFVRMARPPAN